jgi:GNAT superfamily N-acetyltransferase
VAITFRHVDPSEADRAYQWHRAFADGNSHIFPRTREHYEELARGWQNWCALDDDELVGLVYYSFDEHDQVWELGGLMVADGQKGRGVGATLMRVALANLLVDLDPLQDQQSVISHVHRDNVAPRNVIEKQLAFAHKGPIQVPSEAVPGLAADADGYVYGELYELKDPETLQALAAWCDAWEGKLLDGTPAHIELRDSMTLDLWARAIRQMASA